MIDSYIKYIKFNYHKHIILSSKGDIKFEGTSNDGQETHGIHKSRKRMSKNLSQLHVPGK